MLREIRRSFPGGACTLLVLSALACRAPVVDVTAPTSEALAPVALQEPSAPPQEPARGFAGVWNTSYGVMRLTQDGVQVRGSYSYGSGATIEGEVEGRRLHAMYFEPNGTGGGVRGRALFELAEDGASFNGRWRPDPERALELDDRDTNAWRGTRVTPVPGRTWLVILEAHWEGSLAEHEYSYGDMLRSFFERVPNVEVRQRWFHDKADMVRFCHELAGLVEPVVLYISSHGSTAGISAGDGTIDPATIGAALRDAGELRLLHLGSCQVMGGDAAEKIRAAAAPHAPFPISGFKVAVDWAGSAIVDFTYLSLLLEGGMDPAKAVEATRKMLTFAGAPQRDGLPIPGTDLAVSMPVE